MPSVIALNGSPRKKGNTYLLLKTVLSELEELGISTQIINLGSEKLSGCMACYDCKKRNDFTCKIESDPFNKIFDACMKADGIILGSPVYVGGMSSQLKAFIDRACLVNKYNNEPLRRKLGAAVVAVRRNGALETFNSINNFFTLSQMIVVGSTYWNQGIGRNKGEVLEDEEGIQTMVNLGKNMGWLISQINQKQNTPPEASANENPQKKKKSKKK
jgi:multimeric flavodoxin WrbA